jgi:hypothetical protein
VTAWDFPVVIIAALGVALAITYLLIRASAVKRPPVFECSICGRRQDGGAAREWRFCPYCGAPRHAKHMAELLRPLPR